MVNFDHFMPVRLITGRGCVEKNSGLLKAFGKKCLLVTSGSAAEKSGALKDMTAALKKEGIAWAHYDKVEPNPTLEGAREAGLLAQRESVAFIVGIGGGSALDAAKATAVFAANDIEAMRIYNLDWPNPALPLVLVGTTAGTGSEVAPYAVMTTPDGIKRSFTSDQCYAQIAFGDAAYTDTLPLRFTVSTALDALSHALEGYFATTANTLSDLFAIHAVRILHPQLSALREVSEIAQVPQVMRDELYYASILAGLTLNHCGTCYCHCLGYFLSERHGVPHGNACAVFLPDFIRRAGRLMPDKAEQLYRQSGCTESLLCQLIESLNEYPHLKLSEQEIDGLLEVPTYVKSFPRTAPIPYTMEEAKALLLSLFG